MKKNRLKNYRWIMQSASRYHGWLIFLTLLAAASAVLNLFGAVLLKDLIDAAASKDAGAVVRYSIYFVTQILALILLSLLQRYLRERTVILVDQTLQHRLFSCLLSKDFSKVSARHPESWLTRIRQDSLQAAGVYVSFIPALSGILIQLAGSIYLIIRHAPSLLPLAAAGAVFVMLLNFFFRRPLRRSQKELMEAVTEKNRYFQEALSHLMIVKAFSREKEIVENGDQALHEMSGKRLKRLRTYLAKESIDSIVSRGVFVFIVIYSALMILRGALSYGTCLMLLRLVSQLRTPLAEIGSRLSGLFEAGVSVERLREAEAFPEDTQADVLPDETVRRYYDERFSSLELQNVSFRYEKRSDNESGDALSVLRNVSFSVPARSFTAITGATGSGKSTLFRLLLGLYPLEDGQILLTEKSGGSAPLTSAYRRLFAYVPQGNQLMAGSIREMVCFGNAEDMKKEEEIHSALDTACAMEFIRTLPDGIDTNVGANGLGLSEGQLQRIAIARALFTKRPVLLLDEATSALDAETEKALLENLRRMTDRTVLIVTHRPMALSLCDLELHIEGEEIEVREGGD